MATAGAIRGNMVSQLPRRSRRYRDGRVCSFPSCSTQLSIYNRRDTCFAHTGIKIPRLRGKKIA